MKEGKMIRAEINEIKWENDREKQNQELFS